MKEVIFFDIDTQYDFMHKDGKLYVPDAESIIPNLKKLTQSAKKKNIFIVASADKHGHDKIKETVVRGAIAVPNKKLDRIKAKKLKKVENLIIEKQKHNVFSNPNLRPILNGTKKAYVYGVATDYCVKAAVLGLRKMGVETYVIKDAIKPVFKKNEKRDFALFRKKGAKFLTTQQLLKKKVL